MLKISARALAIGFAACLLATPVFAQDAPAGDAAAQADYMKAAQKKFETVCSACHPVTSATKLSKTREGWTQVLVDMQGQGLVASDEDLGMILDYLSAAHGVKP